jgi:hypothetical protein
MDSAAIGLHAAIRRLAKAVGRRSRGAGAAAWRFLISWVHGLSGMGWYPGLIVVTPKPRGLIVCARCGADYVPPIDWEAADETQGWIRLRCGACEVWRDAAVIERAVHRLDHERMAAELDAFVGALDHGVIDASWFMR